MNTYRIEVFVNGDLLVIKRKDTSKAKARRAVEQHTGGVILSIEQLGTVQEDV